MSESKVSASLPPLPFAPDGGAPARIGAAQMELCLSGAERRQEQGRLYDLCFGKDDGTRVLPWRYDNCPHGTTLAPTALDEGGQMVASYACQPRRVRYRGEDAGVGRVGQTGDVMTHPELRSKGVFTDLHWNAMERAQAAGWPAAWGLPNRFSGHIFFDKLGWHHAGHIGPWNFVLTTGERARQIRIHNGRLAAWGAPWAAWRGASARKRLARRGYAVERLETIPAEVAELSSHVERGFDWMVHRDAPYLTWRFLEAPSQRFRVWGVRDHAGSLVGYAVSQSPLPGEALGFVVDLVGADKDAEDAALGAALESLAAEGCAVVRAYGMRGSHWEGVLERGGFRRPRGYKEVGAYPLLPDHPLASSTLDTSSWYFLDGDRDDEFAR